MDDHYQRAKEYSALLVGGLGVAMKYLDIAASIAQDIGMIVGGGIVCFQAYKIFRKETSEWKRKRAVNDR